MTAKTFPAMTEKSGYIQITAAQRKAMAWASNAIASWTCDGAMNFRIYSQQANGDVMFCGWNGDSHDSKWFMTVLSAYLFITPGGRIRKVDGDWRLHGSQLRLRAKTFKPTKVAA